MRRRAKKTEIKSSLEQNSRHWARCMALSMSCKMYGHDK